MEVKRYHGNRSATFVVHNVGLCRISQHLTNGLVWEPGVHDVFQRYLDRSSVVIEGGSHIGAHTIKLGMMASHVYAFEPMPESCELLRANVRVNGLRNVTIIDRALSDVARGNIKLNWNLTVVEGPWGDVEDDYEVPFTTIDHLNLPRVDLIKLDIEGYETRALRGAKRTILKYRPVIMLGCSCPELERMGYHQCRDNRGIYVPRGKFL